jgi:hypothetical protein
MPSCPARWPGWRCTRPAWARPSRSWVTTVRVLTAVHDLAAAPHSRRHRRLDTLEVVEIVNARLEGTLAATYRVPGVDRAIEAAIAEFRPDCVHVQHLLNLSTGLFDAARAVGASVVMTLHDYWLSCPRDGLRMRADGVLCHTVDHRVCAACLSESPYVAAPLQRGGDPAGPGRGSGGHPAPAPHPSAPGHDGRPARAAAALAGAFRDSRRRAGRAGPPPARASA